MKSPARLDPTDSIYFPSSSTKQPRGRLCAKPILKFIIFQDLGSNSEGFTFSRGKEGPEYTEIQDIYLKMKL